MQTKSKDFRVLLVYPNLTMMLVPSVAIALFTSVLRKEGFHVDLFDTTHYVSDLTSSPQNRVKFLNARAFDEEKDLGVRVKTDILGDFVKKVEDFKPDLLVVSVVEDTFLQAVSLLDAVKESGIPSIMGGVFVTAAPEKAISFPQVNMIGLGEGEGTVVDVAKRVQEGKTCENIPNVWVKLEDGSVLKNSMRPLVNIQGRLPDFSLFDEARFYRPMGGRIFKTVPVETYRGCPYTCSFCNSPMQVEIARNNQLGNFMRRKEMEAIRTEMRHLVETLDPEYFYFVDDSFLARPESEIQAFVEMYEEFKIPFWFNTRPENVTQSRLKSLKSVNCDRISFGLECGNEDFRRNVVLRHQSNQDILDSFEIIAHGGIAFSVNNIIGFPDETRDMVFETIEMNRQLQNYDSLTVSIFTPYHGTKLRDLAISRGYLSADVITTHTTHSSTLNMPHLSSEEIDGLARTFPLYVKFPKEDWPNIRLAEDNTEQGDLMHAKYHNQYSDRYFTGTQDETEATWDGPTEYVVPVREADSNLEKPWGFNCGADQLDYSAPPKDTST